MLHVVLYGKARRSPLHLRPSLCRCPTLPPVVKTSHAAYRRISVETFVLDGKDLASNAAKVSLGGVYIREGNLDVLYADMRALMMVTQQRLNQPNVPLLTDNASREFRQHLLTCQSNPASAQMGCSVTVLGGVTSCRLSNALGASREEPCVAVEDGRRSNPH
jgi:hypothetical protein